MNISQPVSSSVDRVEFTFLTKDEIHSVSVKKIENDNTFDTLLNPVRGGLYDPALGSWGDAMYELSPLRPLPFLWRCRPANLFSCYVVAQHVIWASTLAQVTPATSTFQSPSTTPPSWTKSSACFGHSASTATPSVCPGERYIVTYASSVYCNTVCFTKRGWSTP